MLIRKESTGRWDTIYYVDAEGDIKKKKCRVCRETKDLDKFYPSKDTLGGVRSVCAECEKAENRKYQKENLKDISARRARWREANRERDLENQRRYTERNRSRVNERRKMYATNMNRAAREFGLPAEFTVKDKEYLLEYFGGCALTGETENIHFDHVIPVTAGVGGTVSWNMLPLKAGLNISKGNKNVFEWFAKNKDRFGLSEEKFVRAISYLASEKGVSNEEYKQIVYAAFEKGEDY